MIRFRYVLMMKILPIMKFQKCHVQHREDYYIVPMYIIRKPRVSNSLRIEHWMALWWKSNNIKTEHIEDHMKRLENNNIPNNKKENMAFSFIAFAKICEKWLVFWFRFSWSNYAWMEGAQCSAHPYNLSVVFNYSS